MTSDFYAAVQQQQNADVESNLSSAIDALRRHILSAARRGDKRVVLNNLVAGLPSCERAAIFKAADRIVAEGGFTRRDSWVGESGKYRNASSDLYVYTLTWK